MGGRRQGRWVNGRELRDLLEPEFEVSELFSTTPRIARETMVWLRSFRALNSSVPAAVGDSVEEARGGTADQVGFARPLRWVVERLEAMGLGWSLMALARKRMPIGEGR
jgi:hypothetical protein